MDNQTQEATKEVAIANSEALKLSEQVVKVTIRSDKDLNEATVTLSDIKRTAKDIEKRRKAITDPLNASLKEINAMFKDPLTSLKVAEDLIKAAMIKYQTMLENRAEKKAKVIEDAVDNGDMQMDDAMGKLSGIKQAPTSVASDNGSAAFRTIKKIRITDPGSLPASYFMRERVLEALRIEVEDDVKRKGMPVPTGAEEYEERQVAVRTA